MKLVTRTLAALTMAGLVSGQAIADDVNTVINVNNDDFRVNIYNNPNPKVTIQDYVDEARKAGANQAVAATHESRWQSDRIL